MNNISGVNINKIKIIINSASNELFEISKSFCDKLPFEIIKVDGKDGTHGHSLFQYIYKNILDCDWIISIDEDCFIIDQDELLELLKYQIDNNFAFSGVPDGGVISHRFHNPISPNPFLSIINIELLKKSLHYLKHTSQYAKDLDIFIPHNLIKLNMPYVEKFKTIIHPAYKPYGVNYDNFEEYYQTFFTMLRNGGTPLYLDGYDSTIDNFTTIIKNHKNVDIAYHTWFAREWRTQKERILNVVEHCKKIRK
jgi:hypothetical protein